MSGSNSSDPIKGQLFHKNIESAKSTWLETVKAKYFSGDLLLCIHATSCYYRNSLEGLPDCWKINWKESYHQRISGLR